MSPQKGRFQVESTPSAFDFAYLSRDLMAELEEQPTLQTVAERAVAVVEGCEFASVSLRRRRGRVETTASTSGLASACDALQYELAEGPCLEAVWDGDSYLADDIAHDARWPRWGPRWPSWAWGRCSASSCRPRPRRSAP